MKTLPRATVMAAERDPRPLPRRTSRAALWLALLALHLAVLMALKSPRPMAGEPRQTIRLTLLQERRPQPATGPQAPAAAARPAPARLPAPPDQPVDTRPAPTPEPTLPTSQGAPQQAPVDTPDTLPPAAGTGSLLTSEATRRAIQQATRAPLLSERAASASLDPGRETTQQRLSREMARAGHGDCLKGEFAGAGMGLLSLPFLLAAEAGGKCRK